MLWRVKKFVLGLMFGVYAFTMCYYPETPTVQNLVNLTTLPANTWAFIFVVCFLGMLTAAIINNKLTDSTLLIWYSPFTIYTLIQVHRNLVVAGFNYQVIVLSLLLVYVAIDYAGMLLWQEKQEKTPPL